jgi:hypothetical protein
MASQFAIDSGHGGRRCLNDTGFAGPILVVVLLLLLGAPLAVVAQQDGKRVYQSDAIGNIQYHKQSWVIKGGKLCPTDTLGNIQHHKPCLGIGSADFEKATKAVK